MRGPGRILLPVSLLVAALAFAAAGCGGGKSAEEKWAEDVCTPIQTWNEQIKQLVDNARSAVSSPDATTIDRLKADAQKAASATNTLKGDLQDLPPAPGDNGQTARQTITSFANQMSQTVSSLRSSVNSVASSSSASEAATALSSAAGQISTLTTQGKNAVNSVEQMSSKLKSGFEDADACKDLRS
jgi:gas vesicle protein